MSENDNQPNGPEGTGSESQTQQTPPADNQPDPPAKQPWEERLEAMQAKLDAQSQELARLRQPAQPQQPPRPKEEEVDYEELLFTNPKEAVAAIKKSVREEITTELTRSYRRDQGEREFWDSFDKANPDLKDDRDLTQTILRSNYQELADLPVAKARERLAELTRERIGRYTKKQEKGSNRAVAEGSTSGTTQKSNEQPSKPTTLSEVIKARRAKRQSKATAA